MNTWQWPVPNYLTCVAYKDTSSSARSRQCQTRPGRASFFVWRGLEGSARVGRRTQPTQAQRTLQIEKKISAARCNITTSPLHGLGLTDTATCPHSRTKSIPGAQTADGIPHPGLVPRAASLAALFLPLLGRSPPRDATMSAWADAALLLASPSPASSCSLVRPRSRRLCKGFPCASRSKAGFQINSYRTRSLKVRAKMDSGDGETQLAPLRFETPSGQLLIHILQSQPHLIPVTVDQQLENLQSEKDAQKEEAAKVPQDLLYKRIAEIKEKERQNTLEEIIYCWILFKFMENDISMTPALAPSGGPVRDITSLPNQEHKLQSIHSQDALEMIQNHLSLIMGEQAAAPLDTVVEISNLNLGKLYAASIMYGYFLKRVDERFQLEKNMKTLPPSLKEQVVSERDLQPNPFWDMESLVQISPDGEVVDLDDDEETNPNKLRSYVTRLDADTLQRYATIRSKESVSLIEKQTQALFGRPDIKVLDDGSVNAKDGKTVTLTFTELTHLVLEAAGFGAFLWEAESHVESKYHFVNS